MANPVPRAGFTGNSTSGVSCNVTTSGVALGDQLTAVYAGYAGTTGTGTAIVPSGWTLLDTDSQSANGATVFSYTATKSAVAADVSGATYSFSASFSGGVGSFHGCDAAIIPATGGSLTVVADAHAKAVVPNGTTATSPSATATLANDTALVFYIDAGNTGAIPSLPSSTTSVLAHQDSTNGTGLRGAYAGLSASGACPQYTSTFGETVNPSNGVFGSMFTVLLMGGGSSGTALGSAIARAGSKGSATLSQQMPLNAHARASTAGAVRLSQSLALVAHARGSSVATAPLRQGMSLSAHAMATASAHATVTLVQSLAGHAKAASTSAATLAQSLPLSGHARASSTGSGRLSQSMSLMARAVGDSVARTVLGITSAAQQNLGQALARASSRASAVLSQAMPLSAHARASSRAGVPITLVQTLTAHAVAGCRGSAKLAQSMALTSRAYASSVGSTVISFASAGRSLGQAIARGGSRATAQLSQTMPLAARAIGGSLGRVTLSLAGLLGFDPLFWARLAARTFYGAQARSFYAAMPGRTFYAQPRRNMPAIQLPYAKDPREIKVITLDATADLPAGVTLTGTPVMQVTVLSGTDPNPSAAFGTPIINSAPITVPGASTPIAAGLAVQIEAMGSIDGTVYEIAVTTPTTGTPITETLKAVLVVSSS